MNDQRAVCNRAWSSGEALGCRKWRMAPKEGRRLLMSVQGCDERGPRRGRQGGEGLSVGQEGEREIMGGFTSTTF